MLAPDLIYDIGLHVGNDTARYTSQGFRVIAIEANPMLVEHCKVRFAGELNRGLLKILPIGIGEEEGSLPFYINPRNTEWSAFDRDVAWRDGQNGPVVNVQVFPLAAVFQAYGSPYFLKSDIEAGDRFVLDALETLSFSERPVYVSIEAHMLEYLARLYAMGYREFKLVDQRAHGVHACSGPWGDEAPGEWHSFEEISYEFLHWRLGHRERYTWHNDDPRQWFDFHAKRPLVSASKSYRQ
jgi:FkbM family methyltransferase